MAQGLYAGETFCVGETAEKDGKIKHFFVTLINRTNEHCSTDSFLLFTKTMTTLYCLIHTSFEISTFGFEMSFKNL